MLAHESSRGGRQVRWEPTEEGRNSTLSEPLLGQGVLGAGTPVTSFYFCSEQCHCAGCLSLGAFPFGPSEGWGRSAWGRAQNPPHGRLLLLMYPPNTSQVSHHPSFLRCWAHVYMDRVSGFWKNANAPGTFQSSVSFAVPRPPPPPRVHLGVSSGGKCSSTRRSTQTTNN